MFGLFKSKPTTPPPPPRTIRDTLFGDDPINEWPPDAGKVGEVEPWKSFVDARTRLQSGDVPGATAAWQRVVAMSNLESRHYLQAWHSLRAHGIQPPPDKVKQLLGVVVEVGLDNGLDLLAAYPERNTRYYNYSGAGVVWEHPDNSLDGYIDALLAAAQQVLNKIGPWDKPRPGPPEKGSVRLNLLSPAGLHFGQGGLNVLFNDPMAKPTLDAATVLMTQLIEASKRMNKPR